MQRRAPAPSAIVRSDACVPMLAFSMVPLRPPLQVALFVAVGILYMRITAAADETPVEVPATAAAAGAPKDERCAPVPSRHSALCAGMGAHPCTVLPPLGAHPPTRSCQSQVPGAQGDPGLARVEMGGGGCGIPGRGRGGIRLVGGY